MRHPYGIGSGGDAQITGPIVDGFRIHQQMEATMAAAKVRAFSDRLTASVAPLPVRLCDERLTTVSAEAMLRDRGTKGAKRRAVVDQAAAVLILQHALDSERATGNPPGELVARSQEPDD